MNEPNANGKAKDTVFRDMFSQPKYTFQLYQVLHPEDNEVTVDDIKNVTIKRILTTDIYNILGQYLAFIRILYKNFDKYGRTRKAAEETVRMCLEENLLKEYMKGREKEVIDMMSLIFSQEEVDRIRDHNNIKQGKSIGEAQNLVDNIEYIASTNNISIVEACKFLGKTELDYEQAKELLKNNMIAV